MTSQPAKVIEVFISYAQEDERLMRKLEKHLTTLKHQGYITFWNNLRINAGKEWNNEINIHLNTAHVILLLISSDFMSSDYCTSVEVKKALLRHDAGECRVIPIILRPVYWRIAPVSKLQPLPVDGKPVTEWHNKDKAFANIVEEIQKAIDELLVDPLIEPSEALSAAKQPQLPVHSSLSLQQVKNAWDKVIKRVKQKAPSTAAMLKYFEVVGVEDRDDQTVIAIQAQKQGHFNYVCENDRSKDVEWALTIEFGQFGRPCEIRLLPPGNP
jgi:TIR domain